MRLRGPGSLNTGLLSTGRRAARLARQHKVLTGITAAFIVTIIAVSLATSGSPAPSRPAAAGFTLPALGGDGPRVSLSQYQGKPVIVNFFASWCQPCQTETPLLASWYKQQHGKVPLVGLDENDTTANAQKFVAAKGVSYPVGFDPGTTAAGAYHVDALPQTFFLDARHRVVDRLYGAVTKASLAKGLRLMSSGP